MRLGIFGGTFDPPHNGHLQLAQYVLKQKSFEKLIFVPAYKVSYADKISSASFKDRFRMIQLAITDFDKFEVSDVESVRGGESYTIETLQHFRKRYNTEKEDLFLIIGADSLLRFSEWKSPDAILNESSVCVLRRPGINDDRLSKRFSKKVELLDNELTSVSSSDIRERIQNGRDVGDLLDTKVLDYISVRKLYTKLTSTRSGGQDRRR